MNTSRKSPGSLQEVSRKYFLSCYRTHSTGTKPTYVEIKKKEKKSFGRLYVSSGISFVSSLSPARETKNINKKREGEHITETMGVAGRGR